MTKVPSYPQDLSSSLTVPRAPAEATVRPPGATPLDVDTTLPGGSSILDAAGNPALDPVLFLPTATQTDFHAADLAGNGVRLSQVNGTNYTSTSDLRAQALAYGKKFLGTPYVWGGTSPNGFDCSGFVQYVTKHFGLRLPRIAYEQANFGTTVPISQLKPGDLVAWNDNNVPGADHIAFYLGGGKILESPHTGATVRIRSLGKGGFDKHAYGVHITYPGE